jgi:hypothetical protein
VLRILVFAAIFFFFVCSFVYSTKKKIAITKQIDSAFMFGFHWGDSVETAAKWAKRIGLKFRKADNDTATIIYAGSFPGLPLIKASYSLYMPHGKLDSVAVLIPDASGVSFSSLAVKFNVKYGESWDEEDDCATWIVGDILIVLLQGKSGLVHIRYLNMNNMPEDKTLEDVHDEVITAVRALDEELKRRGARDGSKPKGG